MAEDMFDRLDELLTALEADGRGVTIRPVNGGYEVGYITGMGGGELGYGEYIHDAIASAIVALKNQRET